MLTDGKILELFDATGGGIVGRLSRFARAIEAEVLQTQEPAGEIIMYAPCGKLSAPFARPEWHGGALPPVGTKLYTAPQPPAPCQNSTDMEYYRAERDALQAKAAILDGLSQVAIDGGWTYRGMEAYAKRLEAKVAELEQFKQMWAISCAERDALKAKVAEQSERIAELEQAVAFNDKMSRHYLYGRTEALQQVYEQSALIEKCGASIELFLERVEAPDASCSCCIRPPCNDCVEYGGLREALHDGKEALAAIAAHRKGIAK